MRSTPSRHRDPAVRPLRVLPAVLSGSLAGGMLFIDGVLLPFWRATPPAEFRRWFAQYSGRIRALMIPLGVGAGLANAVVAARRAGTSDGGGAAAALTAAAASAGVIAITVTVNEPANHRFADGTLSDAETTALLETWGRWHRVRVVLGLLAAAAATSAVGQRKA